jgi:hypothetical protein
MMQHRVRWSLEANTGSTTQISVFLVPHRWILTGDFGCFYWVSIFHNVVV